MVQILCWLSPDHSVGLSPTRRPLNRLTRLLLGTRVYPSDTPRLVRTRDSGGRVRRTDDRVSSLGTPVGLGVVPPVSRESASAPSGTPFPRLP